MTQMNGTLSAFLKSWPQAVWNHITHPIVEGTNVTQWCKREECWNLLLKRQGLDIPSDEKEDEDEEA
jgi:hypothetical protein